MPLTSDKTTLQLTEQFEGLKLTAYQDVRGIWTIGYGHTGKDVYPGRIILQREAEVMLSIDMLVAVSAVNRNLRVQVSQHQFDSLVDFAYNVGCGNLASSNLLKLINAGNFTAAADEFLTWDKSGGRVFDGLVRRRTAERALFLA